MLRSKKSFRNHVTRDSHELRFIKLRIKSREEFENVTKTIEEQIKIVDEMFNILVQPSTMNIVEPRTRRRSRKLRLRDTLSRHF